MVVATTHSLTPTSTSRDDGPEADFPVDDALRDYRAPMTKARAFAIAAGISWFTMALSFALNLFDVYPATEVLLYSFGNNAEGAAGALGRVIDWFSYFTNFSNVLVAIVLTMLARNLYRTGLVWGTLRMDSLLMISVTGLIYAIVLAPNAEVQGLQIVTNALAHYIIPVLTVLMFLILGPRRQLSFATVFTALIIPILWAVYTLIRGAIINAYPYGFLNAAELGLGTAIVNIAGIAVLGIIIGLIYWALDRLLSRKAA
jgi:hypothetical protein